ncbi:spore germination protein [Paenibacillus sp. YYML68]|uniref:spore germination protein n=1 Tax=Paenibacillus sp. YYML68 TaxID=2909250 RepID=UPI0024900965|nr:spore germination protein [Paenibacillus sp. YYML68]
MNDTGAHTVMNAVHQSLGATSDLMRQHIQGFGTTYQLMYLDTVVDEKLIQDRLLEPFYKMQQQGTYRTYLQSIALPVADMNAEIVTRKLLEGFAAIAFDTIYLIDVRKHWEAKPLEAAIEKVIQGPQTGFSESLPLNIGILRTHYPQPTLQVESFKVGKLSQTPIVIAYDRRMTDPKLLDKVRQAITSVNVDVVQGIGQLQSAMNCQKYSLFPKMLLTERPDRAVHSVAQGKIVLLGEGFPFGAILPVVFYDFISSMEDTYQSYWVSRFLVALRYFGLFISVSLPALYVGVTAFNPEIFRVQLALSIAGSRVSVPYPAFIEVLFMLVMMELLTEASIRLPKTIGSTATTVGGLILGQAATEAGLVSNIMIIIVSVVAISNFVIPINTMSFSIRVIKYVILTLTIMFGMIGLIFGLLGIVAYLIQLESFGQPYFKLYIKDTYKHKRSA